MSRLPIKLRVTIAFSAAMAILLLGLGLFLYLRLASQLDDTIDQGLRTRADEVAARIGERSIGPATADLDASPSSVSDDDESFAQVLTPDGRVVESTGQLGGAAAVGSASLAAASGGPTFVELESVPGLEGPFRALAVPVEDRDGTPLIELVAASLDDRDEALANLTTLLLVGGPISLLLASLAGYAAIGAALRPVEAMRVRADAITAGDSDQRLPVGSTDDELSRLAETLNAMLARLHAGIERERRFVDDASHELRTPLALHKTALELALRYESDQKEFRAAVGASVEEIDRLIQLSEDLLVVARAEDGGLALNRERARAAALLDAVAVRFQARAEQSGRAIDVEDPGDLELDVDPLRIEQALTNMVDNALRHGDGRIRLSVEPVDGGARLHVADEGPGFPPEFLDHAFERFSRADAARTSGGSGLGLAIVETIASAHDGRAGATNGPDGPDVWIEIPARPA